MINKPEYIVVHHSLTKDGPTVSWEAIRKYHKEVNKWSDIGYHKGIENVNGKIAVMNGRADHIPGAHAKEMGMNHKSIGICVIGNYDLVEPPNEYLDVLKELCHAYMVNYNIAVENVIGHREVGLMAGFDWRKNQYKSCPGKLFDMDKFRKFLITS